MLICMRTTLNLDDRLMKDLKRRAAETGRTLTEVIESAVRESLERESTPARGYRLRMVTVRGVAPPAVDITDRDALLDFMEDRR